MANTGFDDKNVIGLFYTSYEESFAGSWAKELSLYNGASDRAIEQYGILGANPAMREWIGARQEAALAKKTYEIRNRLYESTLAVKELDLSRDKTQMLQARMGTFAGDAGANHWEELLTALINANGTCYDGQAFFSATHSWGDSGTIKNLVTSTEVPAADVTTATAPTPQECANIILQGIAHMMTFKNDKGRPINGTARAFTIHVATAPIFSSVIQAIGNLSLLVAGATVTNPLAGFIQAGYKFKVQMIPTLTSATDKIRLYRTDGPIKPFILQDEQGLQVTMLGRGSDFYFDNKAVKLGVDASRGVGYGEPLYALDIQMT